jgi:hypothetical protein
LPRLQLRLLPEHCGVQRSASQGYRRDGAEGLTALGVQEHVGQGLQLQEDRLPEEVLRVLQPGSRLQSALQMLQLRELRLIFI